MDTHIKVKVSIICQDGVTIKGSIDTLGKSLIEFINDPKDEFIGVSNVIFYYLRGAQSFKLVSAVMTEKKEIILNKIDIKLIEELDPAKED